MAKQVYRAAIGLAELDLTGRIFSTVFDLRRLLQSIRRRAG